MRELRTEELDLVAGGNYPQEGNEGHPEAPTATVAPALTVGLDNYPQEGNQTN